MNEQIDINDILQVLKDRIGQLEVDKAILTAQLTNATADTKTDTQEESNQPELVTEKDN